MKRVVKIVLVSFFMLLGAVAALNYNYISRTITFFQEDRVNHVDWFEPTVEMQPSQSGAALNTSEESIRAQESTFDEAIKYSDSLNSSALLVWHKGQLVLEKYASGRSADNYTQTASLHKSLLSLLIGIAISDGAIGSVEDPVSKYLGDWIEQPLGQITIEHLLTMSSGLGKEKAKIKLLDHSLKLLHAKNISAVAQSLPQQVAPGNNFEYINTNPQLLVDVLEVATGQPYESYLEQKIWSKIGGSPGYLWMDRNDGTPHGYCCLIAQPNDLLRIGLLYLNQGVWGGEQIVPHDWIAQVTAPSELNPNYGYLVWRGSPYQASRTYSDKGGFGVTHSEPYLADDVTFFDGFGGQRVYIVPSLELIIVRVGESQFSFDDAILPNRVISALESSRQPTAQYATDHEDIELTTEHSDTLSVRVSYPTNSTKQHPLIIFSHGHYLSNTAYHALTDKWVEHGYVVAAPLHLDTGTYAEVNVITEKVGQDWIAAARPMDMLGILDQAEQVTSALQGFKGSIRTNSVIAAGHSFGALSSQLLAGATLEKKANSWKPIADDLSDPRIAAVVALSPPGMVKDHYSEETWRSLDKPQLVITGTLDVFEHIWTDYKEHFVSYNAAQPGDNYLLVIDGMDHYLGRLIGRLNRDEQPQHEALELIVNRSLVFMDSYLDTSSSDVSKQKLLAFKEFSQQSGVLNYETR